MGNYQPVGTTDSEYAFCALLARLSEVWRDSDRPPALADRLEIVARFAEVLAPLGPANFLYSDGEILFAHGHRRTQEGGEVRAPGLHLLCRRCDKDTSDYETAGLKLTPSRKQQQEVVLFASVPLTQENWVPLGEGEICALAGGRIVARSPPLPLSESTNGLGEDMAGAQ